MPPWSLPVALVLDVATGTAYIPREPVDRSRAKGGIGHRTRAELETVSNMHKGDEWQAMLSGAGYANTEIRNERAHRASYPRALAIKAVMCEAGPGEWNARVQLCQSNAVSP